MSESVEQADLSALSSGDERAFERVYASFHVRVRLVAFRVSHRNDWIDDLANETWCRAFNQRKNYGSDTPFLVWMAGILRNVYREFCRDSRRTIGDATRAAAEAAGKTDQISPELVAHEAEVLDALNGCVALLGAQEARIVQLRYFQGLTLRLVAEEVKIPEATLREKTLVKITNQLRRCLERKKIDFSEIFSAQEAREIQ
ncbi:MAG: RNA polymerase sigma factor [Planctomycetes bacterium]|nr:RNA polymerase sigma factor [Planctomycetota bacterium]